jgi:hypothetical protein
VLSIPYMILTVILSLILTSSPLSKLGSWHIFRTVCHYLKKSFPVQHIQNYKISPTNKLQLDGTNLCRENGAKSGALANMSICQKIPATQGIQELASRLHLCIRNGCRHGIDNATKTQAQSDQTQCKIRCLYELRKRVLLQDRPLFHPAVEQHLQETQEQQRTWITHNKKLIAHSARIAAKQVQLQIQHLRKCSPSAAKPYKELLPGKEQTYTDSISSASQLTLPPKNSHGQLCQNPRPKKVLGWSSCHGGYHDFPFLNLNLVILAWRAPIIVYWIC